MGSEVELMDDMIDEFSDVDNTAFVAVGKNVKESKSLIVWALQRFVGVKICLLHIHQPAQSDAFLDDRFAMHKILNQYSLILSQAGVQAGKVWIEADNVETGLVQTIAQHGIRWLVMGAASERLYSKNMSEPKSGKAVYVCQQAPISCQIWFACKGHLIHTRRNGSTSPSPHESQDELVQSLSSMFLEGHQGFSSSDLHDRLVCATKDAENAKQIAFEESIKRWKAEEDTEEALCEVMSMINISSKLKEKW